MKRSALTLLCAWFGLAMLVSTNSSAQHYEDQSNKVYHITIYNGESTTDGILYETNDTAVVILTSEEYRKFKDRKTYKLTNVPYTRIEVIKLARTNKILRCLGYGAAGGIVAGIVFGIARKNADSKNLVELSDSQKISYGALLGAGAGLFTGFFFGLVHKGVHVDNDKAKFQENKPILEKRSINN